MALAGSTLRAEVGFRHMGKYKQWLHHQEIGRRLRDQINTLEQERARVQKMAPSHPTALPELENPLVAALLNYTRQGNKLSNIDVIKAAMPALADSDPDQLRPAGSTSAPSVSASTQAEVPAADETVVASLLARAEQMPASPLDQMQQMARSKEQADADTNPGLAAVPETQPADSVGSWWQRQRSGDDN